MGQDDPVEPPRNSEKETAPPEESPTEWDQYINDPPSERSPEDGTAIPGETEGIMMSAEENYTDGDMLLVAPEADLMAPIDTKLDKISHQLEQLRKDFQFKIRNDSQKDKVIDSLHQELQQYKSNHLKKYLLPTIMDIIQFIDGLRKLIAYLTLQRPEEKESQQLAKLTKLLKSIPSDLEDICSRQGISPFRCSSSAFNPSRQRILKKLQTPDKNKDKTVAESLRPGYVWDGEVIRPEVVSIYIHKAPEDEREAKKSDE
jgi:molecular chaperone GrpE (heat shock protein)